MTTKNKTPTPAAVTARFPAPPKRTAASVVLTTNQQLATVEGAPGFAAQANLQAVVKTTHADTDALEASMLALEKLRAEIPPLEATVNVQMATVYRDRHNLAGTVTAISGGNPAIIKSWGATPSGTVVVTPAVLTAPATLTATTSKTVAGTVLGKCAAVRGAAAYLWLLLADPAASPSALAPVITSAAKVTFPGQTTGKVMYLRVAVLRRRGGQSAWSEAVQITVR